MRYLIMLALALAVTGVQAQTYRWTDAAGRTVISDTPPPSKAKGVQASGEKPEAGDNQPFALKRAREAFPVTLYTAANCPDLCQQARALLNSRGIPFTEKLLQKTEDMEELKQLVGDTFVPTVKVGNQRFRGFDAGAYNNLLDLAGYPKRPAFGFKPAAAPAAP